MSDGDFPVPGEVGEQFLRLARYPKNIGSLDNPSGQGAAVGKCGDSIEVSLQIETGAIADIKVLPRGCLYTLVCASAMSELAKGRNWIRRWSWSRKMWQPRWEACRKTTCTAPAWR